MASGVALSDADRGPWLDRLANLCASWVYSPQPVVLACSALRLRYRNTLRSRARRATWVFLRGSQDLLARRVANRKGHFMSASMKATQFRTLEAPRPDEGCVVVSVEQSAEKVVDRVCAELDKNKGRRR